MAAAELPELTLLERDAELATFGLVADSVRAPRAACPRAGRAAHRGRFRRRRSGARGNQRSEARDYPREGVELAHRAGAPALVEDGNEELAATGARPRKLVVSGADSLTASERRVAEMAARDLSNKEIGQAPFVTVTTVEVHLSSVYRKLRIGSGRQLAAALGTADEDEPIEATG